MLEEPVSPLRKIIGSQGADGLASQRFREMRTDTRDVRKVGAAGFEIGLVTIESQGDGYDLAVGTGGCKRLLRQALAPLC